MASNTCIIYTQPFTAMPQQNYTCLMQEGEDIITRCAALYAIFTLIFRHIRSYLRASDDEAMPLQLALRVYMRVYCLKYLQLMR